MNKQDTNRTILKYLESVELIGVTVIHDYIQFLFEGIILNTYTLPKIRTETKVLSLTDYGYYDEICSLIGKKVISAYEDKEEKNIIIQFNNYIYVIVSLKDEDRSCAEAATLQIAKNSQWEVW
jgi:hypothetical protein